MPAKKDRVTSKARGATQQVVPQQVELVVSEVAGRRPSQLFLEEGRHRRVCRFTNKARGLEKVARGASRRLMRRMKVCDATFSRGDYLIIFRQPGGRKEGKEGVT
jgi:hypothetical protein